jgi:PBSX family phage terminase large subunit
MAKITIKRASMLPSQREFFDKDEFISLFVGGYGSGKTHIGAIMSLYLSSINAPIPGMYVSPTYKMAKRTIVETLEQMMGRSGLDYKYNKTDHEFTIENWGGKILIGSGEDPNSLKGANLAWAGIDEPFIQKKEVFEQMIARVRHPESSLQKLFLTGTPEQLNWGYDLVEDPNVSVVFGSTRDNTFLPDTYVDNMEKMYTEEQIQAFIDGKFVNLAQGRVCKLFDRGRHVVKRNDLDELLRIFPIEFGQDFNVDYNTIELFVYINGTFLFFDEIRKSNSNTFEMVDAVKRKYPGASICYPDATGKARKTSSTMSDHQILRNGAIAVRCNLKNPPVKDRVNAWNGLLKNDRIQIVEGRCPKLIIDNERLVWKHGLPDQKSDPSLSHAFDAASYPVFFRHPMKQVKIRTVNW